MERLVEGACFHKHTIHIPHIVTDMYMMFHGARSFNQPLNDWNVSNVTDMEQMFLDATSFNQPLHAPWYVV